MVSSCLTLQIAKPLALCHINFFLPAARDRFLLETAQAVDPSQNVLSQTLQVLLLYWCCIIHVRTQRGHSLAHFALLQWLWKYCSKEKQASHKVEFRWQFPSLVWLPLLWLHLVLCWAGGKFFLSGHSWFKKGEYTSDLPHRFYLSTNFLEVPCIFEQ